MEAELNQGFFPRVGKKELSNNQLTITSKQRLISALRTTAREIQQKNNELSDQIVKLQLRIESGQLTKQQLVECEQNIAELNNEIECLDADDQLKVLRNDIAKLELDVSGDSDLIRSSPFNF